MNKNKNGTLNEHTSPQTALKEQSGGNHYLDNDIQPIEYIVANKLNFIDGNIVKYATRRKEGETDEERYNKIIHYAKLGKELKENPKQESWVDGYNKWKKNNVV